ncbi:MAG: hypothetical protein SGPRY_004559 [Prymnesium sp.]
MAASCDCAWATARLGCSAQSNDGSLCWRVCCSPPVPSAPSSNHSICLFLARWGSWPPWISLLMRTMEMNPTISFLMMGDAPPLVFRWPSNAHFQRISLDSVLRRAESMLRVKLPRQLSIAGGASKISDFKPMFGELFSERLVGCDFWGYIQEDMLLGDLRAFLDDQTLDAYDTISPLLAPWYHAGPFMVYRNSPPIRSLFRLSSQWRSVAADPSYLAFDEWWGPRLRDHMPAVIDRERKAGRVRAYVASPERDSKVWLTDDYIYGQEQDFTFSKDSARWYDETLLFTWRRVGGRGLLWAGSGSSRTGQLWDGSQGQRAILHLMGSKHRQPFASLVATEHLRRMAAHLQEMKISPHGVWLKVASEGRAHTWYSGRFPGVHLLVRSSGLHAAAERIGRLGKPSRKGQYAAEVSKLLPCITSSRNDASRLAQSCAECLALLRALRHTPALLAASAACAPTGPSSLPPTRNHLPTPWSWDCEVKGRGRRLPNASAGAQCSLVARLPVESRRGCHRLLASLLTLHPAPPARGDGRIQSSSLLPGWALANDVQLCAPSQALKGGRSIGSAARGGTDRLISGGKYSADEAAGGSSRSTGKRARSGSGVSDARRRETRFKERKEEKRLGKGRKASRKLEPRKGDAEWEMVGSKQDMLRSNREGDILSIHQQESLV